MVNVAKAVTVEVSIWIVETGQAKWAGGDWT